MNRINNSMGDVRDDLLDLYEREGWRALGYSDWLSCCKMEFGKCRSMLYKMLTTAKVEKKLAESNMLDSEPPKRLTVRQAEALAQAPDGKEAEIFAAARAANQGKPPTPAQIKTQAERFKEESAEAIKAEIEEEEEQEERQRKIDDLRNSILRWINGVEKVVRQMENSDPKVSKATLRTGEEFLRQLKREQEKWQKV